MPLKTATKALNFVISYRLRNETRRPATLSVWRCVLDCTHLHTERTHIHQM